MASLKPLSKGNGFISTPKQIIYSGAGVAVPITFFGSTFDAPQIIFGNGVYTTPITSVDTTNNTISFSNLNGRLTRTEYMIFQTTGTLPSPLVPGNIYYVRNLISGTTLNLSETPTGPLINLTTTGSGTNTASWYLTDLGCSPIVGRGLDSGMPTWASIHTSDGVFDWTKADQYMDYHFKQRGRKLLFCFNQTPTWLARNSALDAYGYPGGGQVPTDYSKVTAFVTQLVTRYNTVSEFNPTGLKMLHGIEIWNEPSFLATGTPGVNWCGTLSELAQLAKTINQAAKAVDSTITIYSPGFTNGVASTPPNLSSNSMYRWLLASDGATGAGKDWIDVVAYHNYDNSDTGLF